MSQFNFYALVMAGGRGTRFWPESTSQRPKQYLSLTGDQPLLTKTLSRFEGLIEAKRRFVVTVKEQEALAAECSKGAINDKGLIFEPSGRNTAPCILLSMAALEVMGAGDDDVVAIVPSDHVILDEDGFRRTVELAGKSATEQDAIVTIGIKPNFPHTGYGYIKRGEEAASGVSKVDEFKEKPDRETAESYLKSGQYYWNAGMFVATLKTLKREFSHCSPETYAHFDDLKSALEKGQGVAEVYEKLPKDSIDYAVMEKSECVCVVAADFDWNDLGSWDALETVVTERQGNTLISRGHDVIHEAKGNIVYAPGKHVSLVGVEDLIVVSNEKTVVVLPKNRSQEVKNIVAELQKNEDLVDLL